MSKGIKNGVLIAVVVVIFIVRVAGDAATLNWVFYSGIGVIAAVEGLYLLLNRGKLEDNERLNELFYLAGIGIVLICKLVFFR